MDDLQKDLWNLRKKYNLHIDHLRMKIEQMIMEHELACQSGVKFVGYGNTIHIIDEKEK